MRPRRSLTSEARTRVAALITEKPYLGPQRTAWDLQNGDQITISPSTIKRMKFKRREALLPLRRYAPCGASMSATTRTVSGTEISWRR